MSAVRIDLCMSLRDRDALCDALGVVQILQNGEMPTGIATDSREVRPGDLFVALQGRHSHGIKYFSQAISQGAVAVLSDILPQQAQIPILLTDDPIQALLRAAKVRRSLCKAFVIAVSGSTGKTTAKESIAAVLAQKGRVCYTQGNYNSSLGVPLTLLSFENADFYVIEIGINHPGEMASLARTVSPDLAVLTNVGSAHIGHFSDFRHLLEEKAKLAAFLAANGRLLIPAELACDAFSLARDRIVCMGTDTRLENVFSDERGVRGDWIGLDRVINNLMWCVPGRVGASALNIAVSTAVLSGCTDAQIRCGLQNAAQRQLRLKNYTVGGHLLIDDCYNASPEAVVGALEVLRYRACGRPTVAVLGDMLELGAYAKPLHLALGRAVYESGVNVLITYGALASQIAAGACRAGMDEACVFSFAVGAEAALIEKLSQTLPREAAILFKASAGMKMSRLAEAARRVL